MEQSERETLLTQLTESRDRLLWLTERLSAEQWAFHPAAGRWSIGDCVEHVTRVENRILGLIQKKLEEPPQPENPDTARPDEALLVKRTLDRTERRQAPEAVQPTGAWSDPGELVKEFQSVRERAREFTSTTQKDLRRHSIPHMAFGELDCQQWLLLLALHSERHARQIEEIKADSAFPSRDVFPNRDVFPSRDIM